MVNNEHLIAVGLGKILSIKAVLNRGHGLLCSFGATTRKVNVQFPKHSSYINTCSSSDTNEPLDPQ